MDGDSFHDRLRKQEFSIKKLSGGENVKIFSTDKIELKYNEYTMALSFIFIVTIGYRKFFNIYDENSYY